MSKLRLKVLIPCVSNAFLKNIRVILDHILNMQVVESISSYMIISCIWVFDKA